MAAVAISSPHWSLQASWLDGSGVGELRRGVERPRGRSREIGEEEDSEEGDDGAVTGGTVWWR